MFTGATEGLREAARGHRTAEPAADDDRLVCVLTENHRRVVDGADGCEGATSVSSPRPPRELSSADTHGGLDASTPLMSGAMPLDDGARGVICDACVRVPERPPSRGPRAEKGTSYGSAVHERAAPDVVLIHALDWPTDSVANM